MTNAERMKHWLVAAARRLPSERRERLALALARSLGGRFNFRMWEEAGLHVTPVHFYSTIPDTGKLPESTFTKLSDLPGIDMRDTQQLSLLKALGATFGAEFDALPRTQGSPVEFFVENGAFGPVDSEIYYAMVRHLKPKRIVEIGSGWSTLVASKALAVNDDEGHGGEITAFEPYPYPYFVEAARKDPYITHEQTEIQDVPLSVFEQLSENDILFIDSTHVGKIGSDVLYEFLEILPRLPRGVVVHVHDIFLPADYPRMWVMDEHRFWNEQYLLQALLVFNSGYEVLLGGSYLHRRHPEALAAAIGHYDANNHLPGSFWMRRK